MENLLKENERIDDLEYKGLKIIQNENGFCFGIDAVILSDFAKNLKNGAKILDLGTGTAILPILLSKKTENTKIIGVEIQEDVANMAKRSVKLNNLEDKIEILNENILNLTNILKIGEFDAIVTNPPYKKKNTGIINDKEAKIISRHEITAELKDFIKVSSKLLKFGGEFFMVHRPERLSEIISLLKEYNLEPKILRFVYPKIDKPSNMILIKAVKGGKEFLKVEKPLIVYDENQNYTNEILKIYNKI